MLIHKKFSLLLILTIQLLAVFLLPIPTKAQESYEGGVALINKEIPLNRYNASSPSLYSEDNPRFKQKTGYNVSDFVARNINYQNRERYFNDSLSNMNTCNISTRAGKYMAFLPQLSSAYGGVKNLTLYPDSVEHIERIQAVGQKMFYGAQIIGITVGNSTNPYEAYAAGFLDGALIGQSGIKIVMGGFSFSDINYINTYNGSVFDWVIDYEFSRFGVVITMGEYYEYFTEQTYTNIYNFTKYGYPITVSVNHNYSCYQFFVDWESNHELKTYQKLSFLESHTQMGIEGFDSRLLGYTINNTLYPDNTFYPDRFDQAYQLFYEPYQNFESVMLSFDQMADSDYISMAYEYIGNRWISGENGETFFPTDDIKHFYIDYANMKRHILLSGNLMYLAPKEKVEYIAPFTFRNNLVPTDFYIQENSFSIIDEKDGHFHTIKADSDSDGSFIFQTESNLTLWSVEFYVWLGDGETFTVECGNASGSEYLRLVASDSGLDWYYYESPTAQLLDHDPLDIAGDFWSRIKIETDLYSLFRVNINSVDIFSQTISTFHPTDFDNLTMSVSGNAVFIDAIGISGDRDYFEDDNMDFYDHQIYTTTYENTIFDKRTAGVVYTWTSDHNRYNLTTTYFNYNISFQIMIDKLVISVNDTQTIIDYIPTEPVLRNSYLKRALKYELWLYPFFDGSDYYLGIDFTFDNNRTVVYLNDWLNWNGDLWSPLDFTLANTIKTGFYMYDVDTAAVIVFTSAIKSLLKSPTSETRLLTLTNKQYLSRKILYYRFSDSFSFAADDMRIFISDGVLTREIATAKSIIPLNLTATQRIIQANTTQYNSAECLTQINLFNKTAQIYSESGFNASTTLNDSVLSELPVNVQLNSAEFNGLIPLSSAWYTALGAAISTAAIIVQQAASNPIGMILSVVGAIGGGNYLPITPIGGGRGSGYSLPIQHGGTIIDQLIRGLGTSLQTETPTPDTACEKLAKMVAGFSASFFGVVLAKKIWELTQMNSAYALCNMLEGAWNFLNGVNPTTVSMVRLTISVEIHGVFSFTEQVNTDNWIGFIIKFLTPFILPIIFGTIAARFNRKLVPIGLVLGLVFDGVSQLLGWDYVVVFAILGAVGSYFFFSRPSLAGGSETYENESRARSTFDGSV